MVGKPIDHTGQRFGYLLAVRSAPRDERGHSYLVYVCDCGNQGTARTDHLLGGRIKRCGDCAAAALAARATHGHTRHATSSRTYKSWRSMRERCNNPAAPNYAIYGGRGITVCERWQQFENFLADMGARPEGKSIDRIDNNKGYSPDNCRWATPLEQQSNTRKAHLVTFGGETHTIGEWARKLGMHRSTLGRRLSRGLPLSEALAA